MYIAIDVGGTKINISAFKSFDPQSLIKETKISVSPNFDDSLKQISSVLAEFSDKIEAVAIALPGFIVDENTGIVSAANLPGWENQNIKQALAKFVSQDKIFLLHDAKAHALAELVFANTQDWFLYIAWGTGVGAAFIKTYSETIHFQQVEFGYQIVNDVYIEKLVGGSNLGKRFNKEVSDLSEADWELIVEDFSIGLANLLALNYAPQVIWGGGVALKQQKRLATIIDKASQKFPFWPKPSYQLSSFGENGAIIGGLGYLKLKLG